jgi:MscS family membrane protein
VVLTLIGVNTTTALAGLGLGGIAIALGAQKSVENLLGAIFLLTDKALAVGDFCCVANRLGVIEDITLRSVRLRTLDQTLVSIPASVLAAANIENFTTRGKILIQTTLRLRYGTSAVRLRAIVEQIHSLVVTHPELEAEGSRVRVTNFGEKAIEIELFVYVRTADYDRFAAVREDVLLTAAAIVESAGSALAHPTDYLYLSDAMREPHQTAASS